MRCCVLRLACFMQSYAVVHAASCMDLLHAVAKLVAYDNAECGADAEIQQHDAELQWQHDASS